MVAKRGRHLVTIGWDDRGPARPEAATLRSQIRDMTQFSAEELARLQVKLEGWLAPAVRARRAAGAWVDPGERTGA